MADPVPISFEKHGKLRLSEPRDFTQFSSQHLVPVVFQEFYGLATEFPLIFVRNSESGDFVPVAMMGLTKGRNLYCQSPPWEPGFVPSSFTLTPLSLVRIDAEGEEAAVCIDEDSPLLSETVGEPLYNDDGSQTEYLKKRIDHVARITRQSLQAQAVCKMLAEQKLLRSQPLSLQQSSATPKYEIEGVYTVDEEALANLGDEEFLALRKGGLLPLIYSHLTSLQQFGRLLRRQTRADQQAQS